MRWRRLVRCAGLVARNVDRTDGARLLLQERARVVHGGGLEAATADVRVIEEPQQKQQRRTMTATPRIIIACTTAPSPLSAKKSIYASRITALRKSTIHNGVGITPSAPCVRSARASSRSERSSRYFERAACADAERGSVTRKVSNR